MKLIDTHCHPYLCKDTDEVISNFKESGGDFMISIGVDYKTSLKSVNLAKKYNFLKATIGIHPCDIKLNSDSIDVFLENLNNNLNNNNKIMSIVEDLEKLYLENQKYIVGIGECGFDYHWIKKISDQTNVDINKIKKLQYFYFKAQILLAEKYSLPFIIHNRDAKEDTLKILSECGYKNFILHCFSEDYDFAKKCIDLSPSCMISFSGIVTFKNAVDIQETACKIPLSNILIETDSPYLTPSPFRGKKENEPIYSKYVLDKLCELRSEQNNIVIDAIYNNSKLIFNI